MDKTCLVYHEIWYFTYKPKKNILVFILLVIVGTNAQKKLWNKARKRVINRQKKGEEKRVGKKFWYSSKHANIPQLHLVYTSSFFVPIVLPTLTKVSIIQNSKKLSLPHVRTIERLLSVPWAKVNPIQSNNFLI